MAFFVQQKNTFLGLVSVEEVLCSEFVVPGVGTFTPVPVRRAQSVPPGFRAVHNVGLPKCLLSCAPVRKDSKWSDIMSESTEAPNESSDCEDSISGSASSHGLNDSTPKSASDESVESPSSCGECFGASFDGSPDGSPRSCNDGASSCGPGDCLPVSPSSGCAALPRHSTALRLNAQRYDPRAGQVSCVLSVLMNYLCSIPVVTDVMEKSTNGGKSVRYLVTMTGDSMKCADSVITGAQQALLSGAYNSQNVYVTGHARNPFTCLGVFRWGFQGQLCVADERMCMDAVDFGRCNRWCPRTECRRKHPQASQLTEVTVEIQAA